VIAALLWILGAAITLSVLSTLVVLWVAKAPSDQERMAKEMLA